MVDENYEYRGLMAQTWDLFRGDTSRWVDRFFFHEMVLKHGQPVLDVGCGTGRILLDFLSLGIDIDGIDNSPDMLALCRQKGEKMGLTPTIFEQTMTTLALPRQYQTILVPSSSFQLLLDEAAATEAMSRFYDYLLPGGVLIMPFMIIWQAGDPLETEWKLEREATRPEDQAIARRWSRAWYDVTAQLEHTEDRYEILLNNKLVAQEHHRRSPATRWYSQAQAIQLYEAAGFTNLQLFHEFTQEPATPTDTIFPIAGFKPGQ